MKTANTCTLFTLLLFQTFSKSFCQATKYTAATDYGFGPLYIGLDVEGDKLTRCENLNIALGGGFGPYRLVSVNAADKSTPILLKTNRTAVWDVAVSEGSHVAFNVTDRAGATFQTPLLNVKAAPEGVKCGSSKEYTKNPKEEEDEVSGGVSIHFQLDGGRRLPMTLSLVGATLVPAFWTVL